MIRARRQRHSRASTSSPALNDHVRCCRYMKDSTLPGTSATGARSTLMPSDRRAAPVPAPCVRASVALSSLPICGADRVGGAHEMRLMAPPSWSVAMTSGGRPPAAAVPWSSEVNWLRAAAVVTLAPKRMTPPISPRRIRPSRSSDGVVPSIRMTSFCPTRSASVGASDVGGSVGAGVGVATGGVGTGEVVDRSSDPVGATVGGLSTGVGPGPPVSAADGLTRIATVRGTESWPPQAASSRTDTSMATSRGPRRRASDLGLDLTATCTDHPALARASGGSLLRRTQVQERSILNGRRARAPSRDQTPRAANGPRHSSSLDNHEAALLLSACAVCLRRASQQQRQRTRRGA